MTTDKPRGGLAALCVAELVCWGLLYYSLPVAVTPISDDMGWSHTTVTAASRLAPIAVTALTPMILVMNPAIPAKNLREFVEAAGLKNVKVLHSELVGEIADEPNYAAALAALK